MRYVIMCAIALTLGLAQAALALEADQVRGTVISLSPDQERLRLRIEAAGDERQAAPGETVEYQISDDTEIRMENAMESITTPRYMALDDLEEGARVTLDFEQVGGQLMARRVAMSDPSGSGDQQLAQADTRSSRSRLPDTASPLPLLALGGTGLALLALGFRFAARRR